MSNPIFNIVFPGTNITCDWSKVIGRICRYQRNDHFYDRFLEIYPNGSLTKVLLILSEYFMSHLDEYQQEHQAYVNITQSPSHKDVYLTTTTIQLPEKMIFTINILGNNVISNYNRFLNVMLYVACNKWGRDYVKSYLVNEI